MPTIVLVWYFLTALVEPQAGDSVTILGRTRVDDFGKSDLNRSIFLVKHTQKV